MGKKIGIILQYIIFLGGGIFLIWWQFNKMTPEQIVKFKFSLSSADYRVLIPVIFMALSSHFSRSVRCNDGRIPGQFLRASFGRNFKMYHAG
jgi:hypothetical protein